MTDSDSSSDEEEKAKLKSATWPVFRSSAASTSGQSLKLEGKKGQCSEDEKAHPKQSLRNVQNLEEQTDYRNVDATPELKAFLTKKLSSWLDGSISVVDRQVSGTQTSKTTQDDTNGGFQLFSTSKPGSSIDQPLPQRRQRHPRVSSSDSDSEEERSKLESVAVSYDQILLDSQPSASQDNQVTSNLSPTNTTPSTLTSADPAAPKTQKKECSTVGNDDTVDEDHCHGDGKSKKKKKKKKRRILPRDDEEALTESELPAEKLPADRERGNASSPDSSDKTPRKKRKKKLKASRDPSRPTRRNSPEPSTK